MHMPYTYLYQELNDFVSLYFTAGKTFEEGADK